MYDPQNRFYPVAAKRGTLGRREGNLLGCVPFYSATRGESCTLIYQIYAGQEFSYAGIFLTEVVVLLSALHTVYPATRSATAWIATLPGTLGQCIPLPEYLCR